MCVFNGVFYAFGTRFQAFWLQSRKDISCRVRNKMLDKIVFRQSQFFIFFLQHFIYVPAGFGKVLLALILGGTSKNCVFKKVIHLV